MEKSWFKWSKTVSPTETERCGTCGGTGEVSCVATFDSDWYGKAKIPLKQKCITCDGKKVVPKTQF